MSRVFVSQNGGRGGVNVGHRQATVCGGRGQPRQMFVNNNYTNDTRKQRVSILGQKGESVMKCPVLKVGHTVVDLPVISRANEIIKHTNNPLIQVITVSSPTGSGKSVALPIIVAEQGKRIMVTIPTRLATRALYQYQANRNAANPYDFGYACHGEHNYSDSTKVIYVTPMHAFNIIKARIVDKKPFDDNFVLAIDEAHYKSEENAGTILLAKEALKRHILKKLVIMSATLGTINFDEFTCANIVSDGRLFPIEENWGAGPIELFNPKDAMLKTISKVIRIIEDHRTNPRKGILVFAAGANEVDEMAMSFDRHIMSSQTLSHVTVHRLYSTMPKDEMDMVCDAIGAVGETIVVFTTNVAESSVTIPYIDTTVCMGVQKTAFETTISGTVLKLCKIPKDKQIQRKGRAGRTSPGKHFTMYSQSEFDTLEESDLSELDTGIPYTLVLKLSEVGLDAKSILNIPSEKYNAIVDKLTRLCISDCEMRVTPFGREILKYNMSLEASVMAHRAITHHNPILKMLLIVILSMIEGGQGASYFWIPKQKRSQGDRQSFMESTFGEMKGSNDLISLVNIFSEMYHRPTEKDGVAVSHKDGSIGHWASKKSMNNKLLTNARRSFQNLAKIAFSDGALNTHRKFWSDHVADFLAGSSRPPMCSSRYELKDFCNHYDVMTEIYEMFQNVYYDCVLSDPTYNRFGVVCYTSLTTTSTYTMDTNRGFSEMSTSGHPVIVALQLVTNKNGMSESKFCSLAFPGNITEK